MSLGNAEIPCEQEAADWAIRASRRWSYWLLIGVVICLVVWQGTVATQLSQEVALQKQRVELIIASDPAAIISCDSNHKMVIVNQAAEKLFGYSAKEMLGQSIDMLLPEDFRPAHKEIMDNAADKVLQRPVDWKRRKSIYDKNIQGVHRNGTPIPLELDVRTIKVQKQVEFIAKMTRPDIPLPAVESKPLPKVSPLIPKL